MRQVVWRIENVEGPLTHLEVLHVVLLDRVLVVAQDEDTRTGLSAEDKIDQPTTEQLLHWEKIEGLGDVGAAGTIHATLANPEAGGIRHHRHFH